MVAASDRLSLQEAREALRSTWEELGRDSRLLEDRPFRKVLEIGKAFENPGHGLTLPLICIGQRGTGPLVEDPVGTVRGGRCVP